MRSFSSSSAPMPMIALPLLLGALVACGGTTTEPDVGGAGSSSGGAGSSSGGAAASGGGSSSSGGASGGSQGGEESCSTDKPCNGRCTGKSCAGTWICEEAQACTDDLATYCGCDGVTFTGSGSCPPRAYEKTGPCDPVSCDPAEITCQTLVPPAACPPGHVHAAVAGCYGPCVPIAQCDCSQGQACPNPDEYVCHNSAGHCDYYVR